MANDSWYIQFFGANPNSSLEYDKIDETIDLFKENFDVESHDSSNTMSGFGLYFTWRSTLIGYHSFSWSNNIKGELKTNNEDLGVDYGVKVSSFSIIHYLNPIVGKGLSLRLDIGTGEVYADPNSLDSFWGSIFDPDSTGDANYDFSDKGSAVSVGFAYGFKVTQGSSIDIGFMHTRISTNEGDLSFNSVTYAFTF